MRTKVTHEQVDCAIHLLKCLEEATKCGLMSKISTDVETGEGLPSSEFVEAVEFYAKLDSLRSDH